ncbi:MAG TPA: hypothetical protein VGL99_32055 [Chloroflexota bacterium]
MVTNSMDKRTRLGAVMLIGLGAAILLCQVTPAFMHGAFVLAIIALTFGALYAMGGFRFGWAKVPAMFFSALSGFVFFVSLPGVSFKMWWPLLLVAAGLWIMRRERRLVF